MGHARQWFVDFIQIYDGRKVRGGEGGSGRGSGGGGGSSRCTIPRGRKSVSRHSGAVVGIDCVFILARCSVYSCFVVHRGARPCLHIEPHYTVPRLRAVSQTP